MIKQLAHIRIGAKNLAMAEDFYCNILELEKGFRFVRNGREIGFYVKVGNGSYIEIFEQNEIDIGKRPLLQHFCLEVDDLDAIIHRLQSSNVSVSAKKLFEDNTWQSWTQDPNGVAIEFHQYTRNSCQLTGEDCEAKW